MTPASPLALHEETVRPEWIDYNGHMNLAYYLLTFDHASDKLFDQLDVGEAYLARANCSMFVTEAHLTYDREVRGGDRLRFTTQILGYDAKRMHIFHAMYHAAEGFLAATSELMVLHVDMARRRVTPFPEAVTRRLAALAEAHRRLPKPPQVGRVIGLTKRRGDA
ncbi:MAG: thioesterase family protein [Kiloniellales bacterium]